MMPRRLAFALAFCGTAAALPAGCRATASGSASIGGSVPTLNTAAPIDELTDPSHGSLAACASGDVDANLAIVSELRDSYHEMIVCGGLAMDFNSAVVNVLINSALGRSTGLQAWHYAGNGMYEAGNGLMAVRASVTGGDPIGFDVLDPQSYLVGVQVNASGAIGAAARGGGGALDVLGHAAGKLELSFTAEGPGFALLGLSAAETAGGRLSIDPLRLARSLADRITLATRVSVDDEKGGTKIHYIVEGDPQPIRQTLSGRSVPFGLVTIQGERPDSAQTIKITNWTMQYRGDGQKGMLDGEIAMDIEGGAFPYHVVLTYPHRKEPDVKLSCR